MMIIGFQVMVTTELHVVIVICESVAKFSACTCGHSAFSILTRVLMCQDCGLHPMNLTSHFRVHKMMIKRDNANKLKSFDVSFIRLPCL